MLRIIYRNEAMSGPIPVSILKNIAAIALGAIVRDLLWQNSDSLKFKTASKPFELQSSLALGLGTGRGLHHPTLLYPRHAAPARAQPARKTGIP